MAVVSLPAAWRMAILRPFGEAVGTDPVVAFGRSEPGV